jgi:hypothetical protein
MAFIATLSLAAVLVWWVILRVDQRSGSGAGPSSWQQADTPPSREIPGNPWLVLPEAWTEAAAPIASAIGPATGEGEDVFAVADGIVVFSGIRDGVSAVVLGHRDVEGNRFESVYRPLTEAALAQGSLVGRGMRIGRRGEEPLGPVFRKPPIGIEEVDFGKSPLAEILETQDSEAWMSLEIGNAERMLELRGEPEE